MKMFLTYCCAFGINWQQMVMLTIATCSVTSSVQRIFTLLVRVLESSIQTSEALFQRMVLVVFHEVLPEDTKTRFKFSSCALSLYPVYA